MNQINNLPPDIKKDIETISSISAITQILDVVCRTTGMGFAAIARVTSDRWVACAVKDDIQFGLRPGDELNLETTICNEIKINRKAVVIDHVAEDEKYSSHHTPLLYGFQSYISVPIYLKDGAFFGTLCSIDPRPANLKNTGMLEMFNLFSDLVSYHISTAQELLVTQQDLQEEKKTAGLREQFIAVLGHDLRNPVNAIANSAQALQSMPLEPMAKKFVGIIRNSTFRMNGLIENILDFARGRLGGGIQLNPTSDAPVESALTHVIAELQVVYPNKKIDTRFHFSEPVNCDTRQIAQLFSNLLGNAITHGDKDSPVLVQAISNSKGFSLSVCNGGKPLTPEALQHIFEPFYRADNQPGKDGLGLGLYIASEIARAHGGRLQVASTETETCFTFLLP